MRMKRAEGKARSLESKVRSPGEIKPLTKMAPACAFSMIAATFSVCSAADLLIVRRAPVRKGEERMVRLPMAYQGWAAGKEGWRKGPCRRKRLVWVSFQWARAGFILM